MIVPALDEPRTILRASQQPIQFEPSQVTDRADRDVGGPPLAQLLRIEGVVPLARKDRCHPAVPLLFQRLKNAELVVYHDVAAGGIKPLDIIQSLLLMNIDQDIIVE